jgi:cobalt transporter subunit CbtA
MIARVLLAVLLCGITAGLGMGVMQQMRLTPIIQFAETFEKGHDHAAEPAAAGHMHGTPEAAAPAAGHVHGTTETAAPAAGLAHDENAWAPEDGIERTFYTFASSMLSGAGFAAILAGIAFTFGGQINRQNGWLWGLCGFLAVSLAPAAGLAPELPGMPAADVTARQIWWVGTIAATSAALWLLAFRREYWAIPAALALALLPHVIGAPQPASHESAVPAGLAAQFAGLSLGANAVMWLLIGTLLGIFLPKQELDSPQ